METKTNEIPVSTGPLTKEDIDALRHADSIAFFHNPFANPEQDKCGLLTLTQQVKPRGGWKVDRDTEYLTYEISLKSTIDHYGFEEGEKTYDEKMAIMAKMACAHSLTSCKFSPEWITIVQSLRADDEISLLWLSHCYGKTSDLAKAGFNLSELKFQVRRGNKNKPLSYSVGHSIEKIGGRWNMCRETPIW